MSGSIPASPSVEAIGPAAAAAPRAAAPLSPTHEAWRRFRKHRLAVIGLIVLALIVLGVIVGPLIWGIPIDALDFSAMLQGPSAAHPCGTDALGQDLLARLMYGGKISLAVGVAAMLVAVFVGMLIGAISGMATGRLDAALMWLTDMFLALPQLPLLLLLIYLFRPALQSVLGEQGGIFVLIVVVIGGLRWMPLARLVRAQFLSLREKEFVEAARALGASKLRLVVRHIMPNAMGPAIVAGTIEVANAIIAEIDAVVPGRRVSAGRPKLGTHAVRFAGLPADRAALGTVPRIGDLSCGIEHQLHWRRAARRVRSAAGNLGGGAMSDSVATRSPPPSERTAPASPAGGSGEVLLDIRNLKTWFRTDDGMVRAVDGVDLSVHRGETLAVVGESGSGKTVTARSVLKLIDMPPGRFEAGEIIWRGRDLIPLPPAEMDTIRAREIAMVFQEPMTSLNPVYTVGEQIGEALRAHEKVSRKAATEAAVDMLRLVQISNPAKRVHDYPHQFSGGMRQRVMIAMALALRPQLLIADEPTTALDVTIQAQILELLLDMKSRFGMSVMLITHAMGVVAENAQRVAVMYAGKVVEQASVEELFAHPHHPYTQGLIRSIPRVDRGAAGRTRLIQIPGTVPSLLNPPAGCRFADRCSFARDICRAEQPPLRDIGPGHKSACVL